MLLLLFVLLVSSTNVINVVTDYPGKHEGWITIVLDKNTLQGRRAAVQKITWCASTTPNPKVTDKTDPDYAPPPEDIDNCKARGLQHLQLYPNPHPLVRQEAEEPGMVYIDPANVGGWDSEHQADIIVEADIGEETKLIQVVRFNVPRILKEPVHPPPPAPTPVSHSIETHPPVPSVAPVSPPPPPPLSASVTPAIAVVVSHEEDTTGRAEHPWGSVAIVFGVGLLVLVSVGLFTHFKRSPAGWLAYARRQAELRGYAKPNPTAYDFLTHGADPLPNLAEDEEDVVEMDDLSRLMRMGKGATPAFAANL